MEPESTSPRTSRRKPYGYAPNASPWNTKVLIALWIAQAGFSVLCCIVGGALIPSKNDEHRGDDGMSNAFYLMTTFATAACTVVSLGFTTLQVIQFRGNRLHPMWVLVMSCISATFWISVLSMAAIGLSSDLDGYYESYGFEKYDGVYVMNCIAVGTYWIGLLYVSIVFHRFKKNQALNPESMLNFRYTPATSPWNNKILIAGWISQAGFSIISVIVNWAISRSFMAVMVTAGTLLSLIFTIPQIVVWRRNHLHPLGVLLMSVFATAYWLSVFIMGILFAAVFGASYDDDERDGLMLGTTILSIVTSIPYFAGLTYTSIIFSRFKKNRKLARAAHRAAAHEGDVELGRTGGKDMKVKLSEIE